MRAHPKARWIRSRHVLVAAALLAAGLMFYAAAGHAQKFGDGAVDSAGKLVLYRKVDEQDIVFADSGKPAATLVRRPVEIKGPAGEAVNVLAEYYDVAAMNPQLSGLLRKVFSVVDGRADLDLATPSGASAGSFGRGAVRSGRVLFYRERGGPAIRDAKTGKIVADEHESSVSIEMESETPTLTVKGTEFVAGLSGVDRKLILNVFEIRSAARLFRADGGKFFGSALLVKGKVVLFASFGEGAANGPIFLLTKDGKAREVGTLERHDEKACVHDKKNLNADFRAFAEAVHVVPSGVCPR